MPSSTPRPVTHADLAPKPQGLDLGSKAGALLTVLCILCGLLCFILALFAEATRSQVTWVHTNVDDDNKKECEYSGNGKVALICASVAFVALAIAMLVQHSFMLIAMANTSPPTFVSWDPHSSSRLFKSLPCQAAFFFISTWVCFAVGEIMLLIGLSVESGHLKDWSNPKLSCLVVREGVFTAAGVFSLITVFLAAGLYATALRVQWLCQEQEIIRREVFEASSLYASPPRSPEHSRTNSHNNLTNDIRQNQTAQTTSFPQFQLTLDDIASKIV
ncbi:hypothetical protein RND81_14G136700 [Saponaria officinalis]|uniref:Transmembrane protein n=1 Tax=Saponaria officinalis TaxID=3572 RepID=A0AAW1GM37_SAPOF